ncbi:MAG: sporulation initiation inhibitor protein soj [Chloroflexi bacterium OLB13]|nr:MAG: sporulation initiation inhibitor protein soj [Chloroflexi bacterium OLB13]
MTRVFVFTNHKGGVGKSTSATNTAYGIVSMLRHAGAPNPRVLLIDTDSQAHATLVTTGTKDYGADNSLYTVLMADRQNAAQTLLRSIVPSTWDADLHVLPASTMLEGAERELNGLAGAPYRLADPLNQIANRYAAIVIDTRPSFSLMTEMGLITATDAIVPVEPRYLETVGLMSVIGKINEIRDGWRQPNLRVSGILVTKMNTRVRGHKYLLDELKAHSVLGPLLLGVVPVNEAISYAHQCHQSIFTYDPNAPASKAYMAVIAKLVHSLVPGGAA